MIRQHNAMAPGEEVLANRIRMCIPHARRDVMLPAADAELIDEVRRQQRVTLVRTEHARNFARRLILGHASSFEGTEWQQANDKYNALFKDGAK